MKALHLIAALLPLTVAQSDAISEPWVSDGSIPTASVSGSTTVLVHDSQTLTVSAPPSGFSWWSGNPWSSASAVVSAPPWASRIPWAAGGPWPSGGGPRGSRNTTFQVAILNSTNYFRYQHNASFLNWNDTLAKDAADQVGQCTWQQNRGSHGENVAEGYTSIVSSVDAWGNERSIYPFQDGLTGHNDLTGNFTQLVWKDTKSVGCAATNCNANNDPSDWHLVCKYWPTGNVEGGGDNASQSFTQNVQSQINDGSGFNEAAAVQGTGGTNDQVASSTGPSTTAHTGENAASAFVDASQDVTGIINGHKGQLGLVVFFAFACAFM